MPGGLRSNAGDEAGEADVVMRLCAPFTLQFRENGDDLLSGAAR
jgi:hypothetical protein